ncbi:SDR family oxidoreductase [Geminicoccus harenae]|uniref:SDR family oxidoreductase n=2 Tax=Geminicoccus harenae TaxID=2498453 RepID=UPI001C96C4B1|nr:SDR family oxidoreductase [Geminicoccus harenae]
MTKLKPLSEQVIVVTGASSGIGLATAQAAAAAGARVVLAARSDAALDEAVRQITGRGGEAIWVHCDVARRDDVQKLADTAIDRFGRIDSWVNNAGVGIFGPIEKIDEADMRQLFDTNFWGVVHGSLVAVPYLERQGGALINVGSVASDRALPMQGIYSASKHAVKGFTDALRMELEERNAPIVVTLIKPGSIGTPMPQHMKNYTSHEVQLPPPIYAPEDAAMAILDAAQHPRRDVFIGSSARTGSTLGHVAPRLLDKVSEELLFDAQRGPQPPTPTDNLYEGRAEAQVRGSRPGSMIRPSLYTRATLHPAVATAVMAGVALLASRILRPR